MISSLLNRRSPHGDRAAVREIFQVPETADVREEVDKIVKRLHAVVQTFGGFAGGLIWESMRGRY
jgi:hypothetical protein